MIKQYTPEDHKMLAAWWRSHNWPVVPTESLPTTGYISYQNKLPALAGFLYLPRSGNIGWVEWIVSNPESTHEQRSIAIRELFDNFYQVCRDNNIVMLVSITDNLKYAKRLVEEGFVLEDKKSVKFFKKIGK